MKSNKDISDLIKDNSYKLEERPSKQAWERLENRLDQGASQRNRLSFFRLPYIAAAVVGLIGIVSVISFMFQQQEAPMASNDAYHVPEFVVEELEVESNTEKGFYEIVEFQKTYQDRLSNPIIEGSGKKLSLAKFVSTKTKKQIHSEKNVNQSHKNVLSDIDKLKLEATSLQYEACIKSISLKKYKATIIYHDDLKACRRAENRINEPESDVIIEWKDIKAAEQAIVAGSIQLLLKLDFVQQSEIVFPTKEGTYVLNLSRKALETYFGQSISEIQKSWRPGSAPVVHSEMERRKFLERFVKIQTM